MGGRLVAALATGLLFFALGAAAQDAGGGYGSGGRRAPGLPAVELPAEPVILATHEIAKVRMVVLARGVPHPWALAFLPDGGMLVTERDGRLRIVRDGVLDPEPVAGVPTDILSRSLSGLMEVAVHPDFAQNRLVYLTYTRQIEGRIGTVALVRGRLEGQALTGVEDVFVAES